MFSFTLSYQQFKYLHTLLIKYRVKMKTRKYTEPHVKQLAQTNQFDNQSKNHSVSKIIDSYQQLLTSLNAKIQELTLDLQLTRKKLGHTENQYATLLTYVGNDEQIDVSALVDKVNDLEKRLLDQTAELNRCKIKLSETASSTEGQSEDRKVEEILLVERKNLSNYFNFEAIRNNDQVLSRKRKNSLEEQSNSLHWQKAIQQFSSENQNSVKFKEKTISYLKKFIPHQQRLKVWPIIFGNQLGVTDNLYIELQERRMKGMIESHVVTQIKRDIDRSFNCRGVKNREGLGNEVQQVLQMFHLLRPDVSYVQGMTYPAIVLTSVVGKIEAFKIFSNFILCNKFLRDMYTFQHKFMGSCWKVFDHLLKQTFPDVARHLESLKIQSEIFLIEWFFTMFSRGHSLETTMKIWDMYGYQGQAILYKLSISIFQIIGKRLLTHNYEHTLGLIQSYWSYIDEHKLLESVCHCKIGVDKISRTFQKLNKSHN